MKGFLSVASAGVKGDSQVASVQGDSALRLERLASPASRETALRVGFAAIAALLLLRFVLAASTDLSEDEAYYWLWSRSLASGYYDHPPMIAYWIRAGTAIFGQTELGVRIAPLLSALAGSYLLYKTSLGLFHDRTAAWLCVFWMNATLLCNAAAVLATPDTPLALFTAAALFSLAKLVETKRGLWWYVIGASLGLAFMSKYTAALLLPGLLLWMAASAEGRRWFLRPEPYIGAVIALLVIAPVVSWNYAHDWASFAKQAGHGIKDKPANAFLSVAEFFGGQAGLATPLIFLFCLFGSGYALLRGVRQGDARWLLLGSLTAPIFAFFVLHAANQKIQANWPGFVYPAAILAAVHAFRALSAGKRDSPERTAMVRGRNPSPQPSPSKHALACLPSNVAVPASGYGWRGSLGVPVAAAFPLPEGEGQGEGVRRWRSKDAQLQAAFRLAPWIGVAFTAAAFFQLGLGLLPLPAKKDPTSRLKGWSGLGVEIERLKREHGAALVLTNRYAITGELAFYGPGPQDVAQITERIRYVNLPPPDGSRLERAPALILLRNGGDPAFAAPFFADTHKIATLVRQAGYHPHESYDVYLATHYRGGLFGCEPAARRGEECN